MCGARRKLCCHIFKNGWSNVLSVLFYGGFNGIKHCHIFVEQVFLVQVITKY